MKNPDVADLVNTILKMADKRALVAATLIATGMSEYFTQDIEDFVQQGDFIDGRVTQEPTRSVVNQTNEVVGDIELINPMGSWAVEYASKKWNISSGDAAKEIAKKNLGKSIDKSEFIRIVTGE